MRLAAPLDLEVVPVARLPDIRPAAKVQGRGVSASAIEAEARAGAFGSLANAAGELRQQLQPMMDQQAEEAGAQAARDAFENRDDPSALPNIERRRVWSRSDAVYNQALEAGFVARAQGDLEAAAARLREEHAFDPEGYESASASFLEEYMGQAVEQDIPLTLSQQIELEAQRRFTREGASIAAAARERDIAESQDALERRLTHLQSRLSTGIAQDSSFTESEEFDEIQADMQNVVSILVDNPAYGWSSERGAEVLDSLANGARESVLYNEVDRIYSQQGEVAAAEFIEEQVNTLELTNEARIGLRSRLHGRVNLGRARDAAIARAESQRDEAARQAADDAGSAWEAEMIRRHIAGEPIEPELVAEGYALVGAGGLTAARFDAQYRVPSPGEVNEDPAEVAAHYDMARSGESREAIEQATLRLVRERRMDYSTRESILSVWDTHNDERVSSGLDSIRAFFSQSEFADFDNNLPIQEDDVRRSLLEWAEANPDATRIDIEREAVRLSVQRGRSVPAPLASWMQAAPTHNSSPEQFRQWVSAAEEQAVLEAGEDVAQLRAALDDLERYQAWWQYQNSLTRAEASNGQQ